MAALLHEYLHDVKRAQGSESEGDTLERITELCCPIANSKINLNFKFQTHGSYRGSDTGADDEKWIIAVVFAVSGGVYIFTVVIDALYVSVAHFTKEKKYI